MTCTTHHICDCLLRKMERLEAVVQAVRDTRIVANSIGKRGNADAQLSAWDKLDRALAELERE